MSLMDDLNKDLAETFFNTDDFGEKVVLIRGANRYEISGLFDTPLVASESMGVDVESIVHTNRLFVRQVDLPDGKPRKGDLFELASTPFHSALKLCATDFIFEKDGSVVYTLKDSRHA